MLAMMAYKNKPFEWHGFVPVSVYSKSGILVAWVTATDIVVNEVVEPGPVL